MKKLSAFLLLLVPVVASPGMFTISQTIGQNTGTVVFNAYSGVIPAGAGMLMAAHGPATINPSQTRYVPVGVTQLGTLLVYEAQAQVPFRTAGTLSGLWVMMSGTNGLSNPITIRLRKNGVNGNQVVTIGGGAAGGEYQDAVHTDTIAAGDKVDLQITTTAGGTSALLVGFSMTFASTANSTQKMVGFDGSGNATSTNGYATYFTNVSGIGGLLTNQTESIAMYRMRTAGTWNNLSVYVATNTRNQGGSTVTLRKNGADTALTLTIPQGQTGLFEDTAHSVASVDGDSVTYAFKMDNGNGSGTMGITFIGSEYTTTNNTMEYPAQTDGHSLQSATNNLYMPFQGGLGWDSAEIGDYQQLAMQAGTLSNMRIYVQSNTLNQTCTITLRKNQADTALVLSIPAGRTGSFEDTTHTVSILSTDKLDYKITGLAGATGSAPFSYLGLKFTHQ